MTSRISKGSMLNTIENAIRLFDQGQQVIETAISKANLGDSVSWDEIKYLDMITLELRKQLRIIEHIVRGFDSFNWKPWRVSEHGFLSSAGELREFCELQSKHKILFQDEIKDWADETRTWFENLKEEQKAPTKEIVLDKQLTENEEAAILEGWDYYVQENRNRSPAQKVTRAVYAKECKISFDQFKRIQEKHRKTPRD